MADNVIEEPKTSVLEELGKDDEPIEEEPSSTVEDDEEIVPDHELDLTEKEDEEIEEEEEESDEDSKEEDKEDKELDLEDKEEDELELAKIPKRQEIKAAFPDIFKKFPQLEHALYREQAYTEVFPTVHDAKDAKEAIEQFNGFQSELLNGNIEGVLKSVKSTDPKAFAKIANNILDSLVRVDPNSHLGVTQQVTKGILNYIHTAAGLTLKKNPDDKRAEQLQIASELIHEALYDTKEVTPAQQQRIEQDDPEKTQFNKERQQFEETRFTAAFNTVSTKMNNLLTNAVTRDIDTKDVLPPYVKKTVIKDVMSELDRQLVSDKPFKSLIDKLWLKAKESNYSNESLGRLETALKNKAKTVLPGIMKAKKGEAMKGLSSQPKKSEAKRELSRGNQGKGTSQKAESLTLNRKESDRLTPRAGESIRDFLMRD